MQPLYLAATGVGVVASEALGTRLGVVVDTTVSIAVGEGSTSLTCPR